MEAFKAVSQDTSPTMPFIIWIVSAGQLLNASIQHYIYCSVLKYTLDNVLGWKQ